MQRSKLKNSVYEELRKILNLNFKRQLNTSGLELQEIFLTKNLVSNHSEYLLLTNDGAVWFEDSGQFFKHLSKLMLEKVKQFEIELTNLHEEQAKLYVEKNFIENEITHLMFNINGRRSLVDYFIDQLNRPIASGSVDHRQSEPL